MYQARPLLLHKVSNVHVVDATKPSLHGSLFYKKYSIENHRSTAIPAHNFRILLQAHR